MNDDDGGNNDDMTNAWFRYIAGTGQGVPPCRHLNLGTMNTIKTYSATVISDKFCHIIKEVTFNPYSNIYIRK